MKKETVISIVLLLILWSVLALQINNDIFLPTICAVAFRIIEEIKNPMFFLILFTTIKRTFIAFMLSFLIGITLGLLSGIFKKLYYCIHPLIVVLKTIPNISYMFLLLLWVNSSDKAVYYIVFFIVFPIFFDSSFNSINQLDQDLKDVISLYDEIFTTKLFKIYLPQCMSVIKGTTISAISLSFKVCIMSEVLGFVRIGIGREMYFDKANLDLTGVFAWTFIVILIVYILEKCTTYIFKLFDN